MLLAPLPIPDPNPVLPPREVVDELIITTVVVGVALALVTVLATTLLLWDSTADAEKGSSVAVTDAADPVAAIVLATEDTSTCYEMFTGMNRLCKAGGVQGNVRQEYQ
ncbi:hypothetical protein EW146_g7662 [Bondarzewia mesenterica]|uniref:Uncharacterized protein n=1 Tax=Bondarzewia mesenterica TaxID=1095465 RepID=A0A4S4LKR5_9AGAM|nr:hypothetical protein EW146_g7662 [Bondarzewia mesenterica]